jgi:transposase InsO family protein
VQYAYLEFVARLHQAGAQGRTTAHGNPYDNVKAEGFFKTLQREEVQLKDYQTFAEAQPSCATSLQLSANCSTLALASVLICAASPPAPRRLISHAGSIHAHRSTVHDNGRPSREADANAVY